MEDVRQRRTGGAQVAHVMHQKCVQTRTHHLATLDSKRKQQQNWIQSKLTKDSPKAEHMSSGN